MKTITSTLFLLALTACAANNSSTPIVTHISASKIAASNLTPPQKAEELAKSAEDLLTAKGFAQANDYSELALKQDPTNLRAKFIRAVTRPMVLQQGLLARVKPLASKNEKSRASYEQALTDLHASDDGLEKFWLNGPEDISTESELQAHFDKVITSLDELRQFIKENSSNELTLKATSILAPDIVDRYVSACDIKEDANNGYVLTCPPQAARFNVTINQADYEMLRGFTSYAEIYFILSAAYDLSGSADQIVSWMGTSDLKPQQAIDTLLKNKDFGVLRNGTKLAQLKEMGLDLAVGLNWAISNYSSLCSTGHDDARNRPGMLFNKGLCIPSYFSGVIAQGQQTLSGAKQTAPSEFFGTSYDLQHQGALLFTQPIRDLRQIGPLKFNACDHLESVGDPTLNGIFPNGDLNVVLGLQSRDCSAR